MPKQNPYKKPTYNTPATPPHTTPPTPTRPEPSDYHDTGSYESYGGGSVYYLSIIATVLVILSFIGGQIWSWMRFNSSGDFFILSNIVNASGNVGFNDFTFAIISSVGLFIASILMAISANKMDDYFSPWTFALTFLPFCIFSVIVPVFSGIILLLYAIILLIIVVVLEEDFPNNLTAGIAFGVCTLLCAIIGIIGSVHPSSQIGTDAHSISAFAEISDFLQSETVSLNISGMDENDCGRITTGEECTTLILIGRKNKTYDGLFITTNATKVILKNLNISDGYIELKADNVELTIYGDNRIEGISGSDAPRNSGAGVSGANGGNGQATIYGKNIVLSGNGKMELYAGNGGNGGNGCDGNDAFLFGSGTNGGNGGRGGDSGYVIDCENLTDQEFEGKIFLTRGVAGRGGRGGDGGGGALFGSSGSDGWDGSDGRVLDYVSGSVGVPDGKIIYN